jgi:hypothetical protein
LLRESSRSNASRVRPPSAKRTVLLPSSRGERDWKHQVCACLRRGREADLEPKTVPSQHIEAARPLVLELGEQITVPVVGWFFNGLWISPRSAAGTANRLLCPMTVVASSPWQAAEQDGCHAHVGELGVRSSASPAERMAMETGQIRRVRVSVRQTLTPVCGANQLTAQSDRVGVACHFCQAWPVSDLPARSQYRSRRCQVAPSCHTVRLSVRSDPPRLPSD